MKRGPNWRFHKTRNYCLLCIIKCSNDEIEYGMVQEQLANWSYKEKITLSKNIEIPIQSRKTIKTSRYRPFLVKKLNMPLMFVFIVHFQLYANFFKFSNTLWINNVKCLLYMQYFLSLMTLRNLKPLFFLHLP